MNITPIIAPRGGINKSLPADLISDLEMSDAQNVVFENGLIKTRSGYSQIYSTDLPLTGAITGMDEFEDYSGNSWF